MGGFCKSRRWSLLIVGKVNVILCYRWPGGASAGLGVCHRPFQDSGLSANEKQTPSSRTRCVESLSFNLPSKTHLILCHLFVAFGNGAITNLEHYCSPTGPQLKAASHIQPEQTCLAWQRSLATPVANTGNTLARRALGEQLAALTEVDQISDKATSFHDVTIATTTNLQYLYK